MPQAYFTSPKRGQDSPPGHRKSPRTHRSGRSSKITSPTPLSPTELANYILERGNTVTSPIIAKMVLDQHLDSRALAEFADESDSEEQLTSLSVLGNKDLAEDFLKTTSPLRHKLPPLDVTRSVRPSLMEIASLLEHAEFTAVSPASTAPAFMTPLLSPSIPEWDLEDPNSPEDLEIFAPMQSAMDDSDDDDLLHSPGLRNFRVSGPPSSDDLRGVYSSLLRPAVPPFTPETMPLLSALDMRQPYGISPSSSQGGADGLGDPPGHIQADLLNRRRSPGDDVEAPRTSVTEEAQEPSAPRMSRATSKMSMFGTDSITQPHSRPSSCPPRADRPRIIIPDTFWQPPPRRSPPPLTYAEAGVQTEVIEVSAVVAQPSSCTIEAVSDAEDTSFYDARSTHSTTESVRDTDEETDDFHGPSQSGGEEHVSAPTTPRQPLKAELAGEVPTPRASTPAAPAPTALPATNPHIQRLKSENATLSSSPTAPPLVRTTSEPVKQSPSGKHQNRPSVDIKAVHSSVKGSASQGPRSAPVTQSTPALPSRSTKSNSQTASRRSSQTKPTTASKANAHSGRTTQGPQSRKQAETTQPPNTAVTNQNAKVAVAKGSKSAQPKDLSTQSHSTSHVEIPTLPSASTPKQATDVTTDATQDIDGAQQDEYREATGSSLLPASDKGEDSETMLRTEDTNGEPTVLTTAASEREKKNSPDTTVDSQGSTTTTSAVPGEAKQVDQQAGTNEETSSTTSAKGKEVEDSNVSTPKPPVKVQLLVGATTGSGTTPTDELSSEAQEQMGSAMSSSLLPDSTSSEGLSSSESTKEHADDKELADVVNTKSTIDQPSTPSTPLDSTASKLDAMSPPDQVAAGASDIVIIQNPSVSTVTDISKQGDVTSLPALEPENLEEEFTHIQASDVHDTSEQLETIDSDEAKGASKQAVSDDNGDPTPVQDADASAVASATPGTSDQPKEGGDDAAGQTGAIIQDKQSSELSENATQVGPTGDAASVQPSKKRQVDPAVPEIVPTGRKPSGQPSAEPSDAHTEVRRPTALIEEDRARAESPILERVRADSALERENSQTSDSRTEDGDTTNAEGNGDENEFAGMSAADKKKAKEKAKKKRQAENKKLAKSSGGGIVQGVKSQDTPKEKQEDSIVKNVAGKEASVTAQKAASPAAASKKAKEAEEAKKRAEEEAANKQRAEEEAEAERQERQKEAEQRAREEAQRKRAEDEQRAKELVEAEAERKVLSTRQRDKAIHLRRLPTQDLAKRGSFNPSDLESGRSPIASPMPSPIISGRRGADIENQKKREGSPASTHSKGSGSSLLGWFSGKAEKLF